MRLLALLNPLASLLALPLLDRLERWMDGPAPERAAPAPEPAPERPPRPTGPGAIARSA